MECPLSDRAKVGQGQDSLPLTITGCTLSETRAVNTAPGKEKRAVNTAPGNMEMYSATVLCRNTLANCNVP